MKNRCAFSSLCLLLLFVAPRIESHAASADPAVQGCTLRVHADSLRNARGVVGVLLFRSTSGWPEDAAKAERRESSPIAGGASDATVTFREVPPGDYGVVALHDENKNMKLDKNMFGYPKEGFGFGNNPHVGLGPPAFRSALVHVACPVTDTEIHIIYK
jgi:uncharacterized protein (DUF2141 family)